MGANRNTANYKIEQQYICFYDGFLDLSWAMSEVEKFRELWEAEYSVRDIAIALKRHPLEVTLLIIDLVETDDEAGQIEKRPFTIYEGVGI